MKKGYIISVILNVVLIIILGFLIFNKYDYASTIKEKEKQIKSLQQEVQIYFNTIRNLEKDFKSLQDSVAVKDTAIKDLKTSIINIRRRANEKIKSVDTLTNAELQRFFSDRYGSLP